MYETDTTVQSPAQPARGQAAGATGTLNAVMSVLRGIRALRADGDAYGVTTNLSDAGFTSLEMVQVMLATEAAFDIMIPQQMITPGNFSNAASIAAMVESLASAG